MVAADNDEPMNRCGETEEFLERNPTRRTSRYLRRSSTHRPLLKERLWRLVASLPEKPRMVVILRYGEDMDAEKIGEALGMPVRTVWSHLQRAIALMREKASRYLKEESNEAVR